MDLICEPRWGTEVQELSTTVPETGRKDHPFQLVEYYIGEVLY